MLDLNDKSKVCAKNTGLKIINKYMVTEAITMEEISQEQVIVREEGQGCNSWKQLI